MVGGERGRSRRSGNGKERVELKGEIWVTDNDIIIVVELQQFRHF